MFNFELMNKILLIFALLIASCDTKDPIPCKSVAIQISDANPVQFWPVDCDTYNEKEVCGIHSKCWCQPWQCDDEIKTQFTDIDPSEEYSLIACNSDSEVLATIPFVKEDKFYTETDFEFANKSFESTIIGWSQQSFDPGSSAGWAWSFGGVARADGNSGTLSSTYKLYQGRPVTGIGGYSSYPPGTYTFRITLNNQSNGGSSGPYYEILNLQTWDTVGSVIESEGLSIPRDGLTIAYDITITTIGCNYFAFGFSKAGPSSGSIVEIDIYQIDFISYPLDYTFTVHENSFIPNDEDICDQQIQLKIESDISSPAEVAKSDCLDIATLQKCTTLIEYSNNRNFAGLIYQDISPEQIFNIRVPAIFFHEEFPEEDEAMDLTTGIVKTSGTVKVQRLFDTDYMPYYMHLKLKLIFKHQTINIDNLSWIKEAPYEIQEGNRMWPVKKAKVFLTENYIQRAVL